MGVARHTTEEQIEAMRREISRAKQRGGRKGIQKNSDKTPKKKGTLIARAAGWVLFSGTVIILLATLASVNITKSKGEIPVILGFQLFMVESGSMEPTLPVGTVILSRQPRDARELKAKDIVTFRSSSGSVVTHRIIEVLTDDKGSVSYRTKGDNPISSPDLELLVPDNVIAVFIAKIPLT